MIPFCAYFWLLFRRYNHTGTSSGWLGSSWTQEERDKYDWEQWILPLLIGWAIGIVLIGGGIALLLYLKIF